MPVEAQAPTPHVVPKASIVPSQSLSRLSQLSADGGVVGAHIRLPPAPRVAPAPHTPSCPVLHNAPPPGLPSSAVPSQSSSALLQISAPGAPGRQLSEPAVHVPLETQAPMPQVVANPSTVPSQLLSRLSQI